jgi:tetratricopeptide (TPR) repeat protein
VACLLDAPWLAGREHLRQRILAGCMAAVAVLGMACIDRQTVWANSLALWDDSYRKNPGSFTSAAGLGEALYEAGRFSEAEQFTRDAIRLSDGQQGDAWATLALILEAEGRTTDAATALAKALEIDPRLSDPEARVKALAMGPQMAAGLRSLLEKAGRVGWPNSEKERY